MLAPGMRRTAQRTMVYDTIVRLGGHCTAEELTDELHKTKPGFARSTVYRALEALTASGSVYAAHLGEGATRNRLPCAGIVPGAARRHHQPHALSRCLDR